MPQLKMRVVNENPVTITALPPNFPYSVGDIIHLPDDKEHAYKVASRHVYPDMGVSSLLLNSEEMDDTVVILDVMKGQMKPVEVKVKDE